LIESFDKYVSGVRGGASHSIQAQQMRAAALALPADFAIEDITAYIKSISLTE
jgi:hypothetical protein